MGRLGRYIDALDYEARDRVVRADGWVIGFLANRFGKRCLVGHAAGVSVGNGPAVCSARGAVRDAESIVDERWLEAACVTPGLEVGDYFDALCRRFGLDRIVRACKLRAGASLDDLPQPDREAVGAG